MNIKQSKLNRKIEEKFDSEFVNGMAMDIGPTYPVGISWRLSKRQREAIKSFIAQELAEQRAAIVKKCERLEVSKEKPLIEYFLWNEKKAMLRGHTNMDIGYNLALNDIIASLTDETL